MVSGLSSSAGTFLSDLVRIQQRLERAQRELSSGYRVQKPSDDPDVIGRILSVRASLEQVSQIARNLERGKAEVDAAEQALQAAVKVMERVNELGTQAANSTQTAQTRAMIAQEIRGLHEQLVDLADTMVEGRYIFHGDADGTPPYAVDLGQPNGVTAYDGATSNRQLLHPNETSFTYRKTAQEIFDNTAAAASVFGAVNSLRAALEANDPAQIDAARLAVRRAFEHLNTQLGFYGSVQNHIADALDSASRSELQHRALLSELEEADITAAALELTQASVQLNAAMNARARMPRETLFDYLR